MPEITRPLYVQYTGNNIRQGCCECIAFGQLDEDIAPTINTDKVGNKYKLGYCSGVSCKEECYFVLNTKSKEYVLHKDQQGNWCGLIAPENYLCTGDKINEIKKALIDQNRSIKSIEENIKNAQEILDNPLKYDNFVFDYFKFFGPGKNAQDNIRSINSLISNMEDELKKPKTIKNNEYYLEVQKNIDNYKKILETYRRESLTPDSDFNKKIKEYDDAIDGVEQAQNLINVFATELAIVKSDILENQRILRICELEVLEELIQRYQEFSNTRNK